MEKAQKDTLAEIVATINGFFDKKIIEDAARDTKFVQRESKLTGHVFLCVFVFAMTHYSTPTLNQLIGILEKILPELKITRQGFHERINEHAVEFFEFLLGKSVEIHIPGLLGSPILEPFGRVLIHDSTSFQLPDELAGIFKGSGGSASKSAVKIQFGFDLKNGHFFYVIQDGTSPDNKKDNNFIDKINKDDLNLRDLGYFNIQTFYEMDAKGAYFLSRLLPNVTLYKQDTSGILVEFNLINFLKGNHNKEIEEIDVFLKKENKDGDIMIKVRLVIEQVPPNIKEKRVRDLNRRNKKKGCMTSDNTKVLQGFNLHISNVPSETLAKENFRKLYTIRWQVELVFKNWKSNFHLDKVTGFRPERIKCMIYSKLLLIFVNSKFLFSLRNYLWNQSQKEISEIQASKHMQTILDEWFKNLILCPEMAKKILYDSADFIMRKCVKTKQKNRVYPIEMLCDLSLA